jgi:hypothetical protein
MNLANRSFRNNKTGEVVRVIDSFENIAVLENKQRVDVRTLTDVNFYTEQIDPSNFFNNQGAYNILADKIKNIPQSVLNNFSEGEEDITDKFGSGLDITPQTNESAIIMSSEEDEMAELARKYGASMDTTSQVTRQNEAFARILGEESENELPVINQQRPVEDNPVVRVDVDRDVNNLPGHSNPPQPPTKVVEVEDPIITMFRKTKRNVNFNFSFNVTDKIPRLDFIEMMEDSYEISMIEFLADEFTSKILSDPSSIKEKIKNEITRLVYGSINSFPTPVNDQITDSVTQTLVETQVDEVEVVSNETKEKPKTTRKPRAKKESTQK